ncbi:MAG TPA: PCMD domain-containing protein [Bacteroidales bacterium]|nr:PCMD domain-containing protein [Bacteroidales bacterium]HSA43831.1 PCMD domain-containing protein [Bacteroidales bacterium]
MKPLLLIIILFVSAFITKGQNIPNAGMENWISSGSWSDPQFWDSPNQQTTAIPFIGAAVVSKSNDAFSGSWSARLENKSFIAFTVPGLLTLGQLDIDLVNMNFGLRGGVAFNQRPVKLKGYYKYTQQGNDSCAVAALFYKHNPGGWQDTVGLAWFIGNSTVSQWTQFEAVVDWYTSDTPDTMNILISSSASFTATAGSVLLVDDLFFDYNTPVVSVSKPEHKVSLIFSDVSRSLKADYDLPAGNGISLSVLSITGQSMLREEFVSSGRGRISQALPKLVPGLYIAVFESGDIKKTMKFVLR